MYSAGDGFRAFDIPVGRLGRLIDYDKTFPESACSLALDGPRATACLPAWPASVTDRATRMTRMTESPGGPVGPGGPGGDVLARTWTKGGLA